MDMQNKYDMSELSRLLRREKARNTFWALYPAIVGCLAFVLLVVLQIAIWLGVVWTLLGLLEPDL